MDKDIIFDKITDARLKYSVYASGIKLTAYVLRNEVHIKVLNSNHTVTPGYIPIPYNKLPELIDALIAIRNENPT